MIPVSNIGSLEGMQDLRKEIIRIANDERLCPSLARDLPESWIQLEQFCHSKRRSDSTASLVMNKRQLLVESGVNLSMDELRSALLYLDLIGQALYFDFLPSLSHLIFLNPMWLMNLMKKVFRPDHVTTLLYKKEFQRKFGVTEIDFNQAKDQLLNNAWLTRSLLR